MLIAKVALAINHLDTLDYLVENIDVFIGDIVLVPFRKTKVLGIVTNLSKNVSSQYLLKSIISKFTNNRLSTNFISFIKHCSDYYCVKIGCIVKASIPIKEIKEDKSFLQCNFRNFSQLSEEQSKALAKIKEYYHSKPILLRGVTGSGKTEVYFHLIKEIISNQHAQILIMIPEIALSTQYIENFKNKFNFSPDIWHSKISYKKKQEIFYKVISGKQCIVLGTRSALFLPYKKLNLIVVDEEHDASYKQENYFCYNARDMAVLRSSIENFPILLTSATPSLETYNNVISKKYHYVELNKRFFSSKLPPVKIIDMTQVLKQEIISCQLKKKIQNTLEKNRKVLLFLNKRGYCPLMICSSCGYRIECTRCSTYLMWHKSNKFLSCSYCQTKKLLPQKCPDCLEEKTWISYGPGVEKVQEETNKYFPQYKSLIISKDNMKTPKQISENIKRIQDGEIDIIIGTQIIVKGYNFPLLTTVCVLDADFTLCGHNIKASEKTFQILHQVGGRSGRYGDESEVLIQTYLANSKIMQIVKRNDFLSFANYELQSRKSNFFPPFSRACKILVTSKKRIEEIQITARLITKVFFDFAFLRVLGPAEEKIVRVDNQNRMKILIMCDKNINLSKLIQTGMKKINIPAHIKIKIDIDPTDVD